MTGREIVVAGRKVWLAQAGSGAPILYLHGFADIHGIVPDLLPFHEALAADYRLIAPAHPGCAGTDEDDGLNHIEDLVFHYLEVIDALELDRFHLVGSCLGGWIAAELAVRFRERIDKLVLIGASGLFVEGKPISDIFWVAQPEDGVRFDDLRALLFARSDLPLAKEMFPDPRGELDRELLRYKMFRLASRVGFKPPYLHNRKLRARLNRFGGPALVLWGSKDRLVPLAHAEAYAQALPAAKLEIVEDAGHSLFVEQPEQTAEIVKRFLAG